MRAVVVETFGQIPTVSDVEDPVPDRRGIVLEVKANGVCRSDWHAWMGHDATVTLPHVPGHEMAGEVVALGSEVRALRVGDRVTVPFACGCGECRYCRAGQLHICDHDFQPGFTHWGSFAQYVEVKYADLNVVRLPDTLNFVDAASLGCRFSTAYRAVVQQANVVANQWLAIHGCGGLGLSAVMIGKAVGARVIAVDIRADRLQLASELGAEVVVDAKENADVASVIMEYTQGGADASLDALGSRLTAANSIHCLRKQGCHVQVGLLLGSEADPPLPMGRVIGGELRVVGSHGMSAHDYPALLDLVATGSVDPGRLVNACIRLDEAPDVLAAMGEFQSLGVTVINEF